MSVSKQVPVDAAGSGGTLAVAHGDLPPGLLGLSRNEVLARRAHGQGNVAPMPTSRSYRAIVTENVFTFINISLLLLGIALAVLGRPLDALTSTAVISVNILVSVFQEIRAKRTLDRIALLTRPRATVVREGRIEEVAPEEIVAGDVLAIDAGDQIVADGELVGEAQINVDESQLTGESDQVAKHPGDPLYSGSFCVSGSGYYVADRVGAQSLAHEITAGARAFRRVLTPLQQEVHLVIRLFLLMAVYLEFLLFINALLKKIALAESVQNTAVIAALVPNGLFLSIAVAYALGAVRLIRFGLLVQQANAIESLSNVDVLCLDKTGTLTANRLRVTEIYPLGISRAELQTVLGAVAAGMSSQNKTGAAIAEAFPHDPPPLMGEIPFSSARKWSAVAIDDPDLHGVYLLGAPEMVRPYLTLARGKWDSISDQVHSLAASGLRVLLVARDDTPVALEDRGDESRVPEGMTPLGLVSISDELRAEAQETLAAFVGAGVHPKIISGDNPDTVLALARQAGMDPDIRAISGPELDSMDDEEFRHTAEAASVFGRITPHQKERLVRVLRDGGHYVAMIGDGVNDVLSLKGANLGIAMQSGSQAARSVADIVLLQDSFAVLVHALLEGRRIIHGMHSILKLFLTRISTVGLVIISSMVVGEFPLAVRQGSVVTLLTVAVPSIMLAVWAQPQPSQSAWRLKQVGHFVFTPMVLTSAIGLLLFYSTLIILGDGHHGLDLTLPQRQLSRDYRHDLAQARTTLAAFLTLTGLFLVIFVEPPTKWWAGGAEYSGDNRPAMLAVGLMLAFLIITLIPVLRRLFSLSALDPSQIALVIVSVVVWFFAVRIAWRQRILARILGWSGN